MARPGRYTRYCQFLASRYRAATPPQLLPTPPTPNSAPPLFYTPSNGPLNAAYIHLAVLLKRDTSSQ